MSDHNITKYEDLDLLTEVEDEDTFLAKDVDDLTDGPVGTNKRATAEAIRAGLETTEGATAKVAAHADLTDNPHSVTAAQVGALAASAAVMSIQVACSDNDSDLGIGTVATFRMPFAFTLTAVRASVSTAPVGSTLVVDINEAGTSVLSTEISIDAGDKTSVGATTPPVISDSALADDAEITIDIDQVGASTAGAGLVVTIIGTRA